VAWASVETAQSIKKINSVLFLAAYCFYDMPLCTHFCGNRNRWNWLELACSTADFRSALRKR